MEAKYMLLAGYEYAGENDSALYVLDELIDYARSHYWDNKQFQFMVEQSQLLTEAGRYEESDRLVSEIFHKAGPDNGAADMLHFQYAINALNRGDVNRAAHHLAIADSLAVGLRGDDNAYFRSYSNLLHAMIDFKHTGRIKLMHINGLNNRQSERFNRMKASQWETERGALHQQNRALALKAESEHKTVLILIISLAALLILGGSVWIIIMRRQRERDNEERIEALQKMVDEYNIRRRYLVSEFNRLGLECFNPEGAFYVFPCIKSTGLTSEEFCERLLYEENVAVVPGHAFGESGEGFVRVSYAYSNAISLFGIVSS